MNEIKPKKMVRRSVAITLGIICIILIAVIAYFSITNVSAQNSYNNLQNQNSQLQTWLDENITSYTSQISSLQSNNSQLQTNYQSLQSLYNQLKTSFDQLNASYNQLYNQYQLLLSRLPPGQGISIDSIFTQSVFYTPGSGVHNVTVRNLGSSDVHVTSLKLYRGTILASSASLLVTIPANSSVTINQYLPWDQVSPGIIYILKVETLEGYTATSDPLSSG